MVEMLTERLRIRDHVASDLEAMHQLLSDPVAMRYLPDLHTESLAQSRENLDQAMAETGEAADAAARKRWFFAVTDRVSGRYLGEIGYTVITDSPVGKVAQLGYFLLPEAWGQGIAVEAAEAVLRYAFTVGLVFKMETGCLRENSASERVMQKLGMTREADLRYHALHEGVLKDRVTYRMLHSEWTALQGRGALQEQGVLQEQNVLQEQAALQRPGVVKAQPSRLPKAILFDYGQTLIDEIGFDAVAGTEAVLREAVENPESVPAWEVQALADALLHEIGRRGWRPKASIPWSSTTTCSTGISTSLSACGSSFPLRRWNAFSGIPRRPEGPRPA
jgi:ribosomal-protein-alanine N-acetyltransferase